MNPQQMFQMLIAQGMPPQEAQMRVMQMMSAPHAGRPGPGMTQTPMGNAPPPAPPPRQPPMSPDMRRMRDPNHPMSEAQREAGARMSTNPPLEPPMPGMGMMAKGVSPLFPMLGKIGAKARMRDWEAHAGQRRTDDLVGAMPDTMRGPGIDPGGMVPPQMAGPMSAGRQLPGELPSPPAPMLPKPKRKSRPKKKRTMIRGRQTEKSKQEQLRDEYFDEE